MDKKGFTLIELMVTVAIVGILAAIALPNFMLYRSRSRQAEAKTNLGGIGTAAAAYRADHDTYAITNTTDLAWQLLGQARYDYWYDNKQMAVHSPQFLGGGAGALSDHSDPSTDKTFKASAAGDVGKSVAGSDIWTINQNRYLNNTLQGL